MADDGISEVLGLVAPRLRALRRARSMTLADVAAATGIAVSTLSRLESGNRRPSLDLLLPLARVYRVPLDDLVGAPATGDPRVHPKPFRRHGCTFIPLTRNADGLSAFKIIYPGGRSDVPIEQRVHDGYDWVYVLTGRLRLALGDEVMELSPGEAAEFDTRVPHGFASAGPEPVEVISLVSQQGERVHVRPVN
ncbi:helix-turn-helix domain-containing protein [Amnibacterium flavum]|uniref:XRE family transcriptional regulator n=1 Tax=Amnibacterium flavum TaxID=2173173 RepID=A0A2V1HNV1_9MICO|nr:XRE family transcriptional regulator [Amnibacterium flavum]PVZ94276.1 XRE family transcriptional regulator [Amnibacterium flavum]